MTALRARVLSLGRIGYLALYRYDEALDDVLVLAVRHQREAGFQQKNKGAAFAAPFYFKHSAQRHTF